MGTVSLVLMVIALASQDVPAASLPACREWHDCQRLALEAYAQHDYERFHDLAWRTVQTGPARNPELMYLLARAQSLSGRPHDALVMLGRLAEMKFPTAAATDDDFRAVRQLRQWSDVEAAAAATPPSTPPAALPANVAPIAVAKAPDVSAPANVPPRRAEEALRIPGTALGSAGLAYDRVSSRFVVADADRRKLVIIDERSHHVMDLVTAESAGFYGITGFEIDPARGDLWVVSADPPACALHKLQLVSGRPLDKVPLPDDLQPCRLADVAVTPDGRVLLLDAAGPRLLRYRAANHAFTPVATLQLESPTSLAPAGDRIVYVAYASGIARVDGVSGAVEPLAAARDASLAGFERIRWARDSLVGVQRTPDGGERAVRLTIADGRVASIAVIDNDFSSADHPIATVSGDDFYLLVHQSSGDAGDLVIRRSRVH